MSTKTLRVLVCLVCLTLAGALALPGQAQARHGHGWVWALPLAAAAITIAGLTYYTHNGVYYRPADDGYIVVPPPMGAPPPDMAYPPPPDMAYPPPPVGLATPGISQGTVTVSSVSLNVRSGPGYNYSVVTVVTQGSTLTVYDSREGWLWVRTPMGDEGWVAQQYTRPSDGIPADG